VFGGKWDEIKNVEFNMTIFKEWGDQKNQEKVTYNDISQSSIIITRNNLPLYGTMQCQ
jgi:hypothetical protein